MDSVPALLTLRPLEAQDETFSFQVYASTRAEEMSLVAWTAEQKHEFLWMQFTAQRAHYQTYAPQSEWQVILLDGQPAGRLIVDRSDAQRIALKDIAILPEFRRQGAGTYLLQALIEEARAAGKQLLLHVESFNPALNLYQRLGFHPTGVQRGVYEEMVWP
ncbi:MAG TPA: GNAT family N-acetyltransferase [Anaerolineaceae bacterium]|nr:GNAT family N-acetyltransferase [Anaerolineaceae bacterium]